MSALTDLFTALANKIRSKTGTATTYTPPQMVSSGIDDVYNAGVAAGTPTLTGDAAAGNVLSGKTFYNTSTTKQTGSMTNNGAVSQALDCGDSYTVPAGYHNGSGTVTANSLASQTGVDSGKTAIDASHVHSGYQGWVNGNKVSGSYTPPSATAITPSNSSPASMTSGATYEAQANGYAIASYSNVTPGSIPSSVSSGAIVKVGGAGMIVDEVSGMTPTSTPKALTNGKTYYMEGGGYAINSYASASKTPTASGNSFDAGWNLMTAGGYAHTTQGTSVTPSTSGASFSSGLNYMASSGYAYSAKPTGGFSETTLWTNSSPTSSFAAQSVTLSQSIQNFDYIRINYNLTKSNSTSGQVVYPSSYLASLTATSGNRINAGLTGGLNNNGNWVRTITAPSNTSIAFTTATRGASSSSSSDNLIPTSIVGLKFTP